MASGCIYPRLRMKFGKRLLFMCLIFGLMGCGQKSVVKTDVDPQTFAQAYGDGKLLKRSFPLLITTDPFASPIPDFGFLFGGVAKIIANTLAGLGAGRTEMYFHQPTPELPEEIREVRLKRVFFYIEPKVDGRRRSNWFNRLFRGRGNVDFDFIKKLVIRIKPEEADMTKVCKTPDQGKYSPLFPCKDPTLTLEKTDKYLSYFKETKDDQSQEEVKEPNLSELDEFVILKYDGNKKSKYVRNETRGAMYMFRTQRPGETNHFFNNRSGYRELIDNMVTLDNVILVELKKDPVVKESFEARLSVDAAYIDENLGVEQIEECTPSICLDLKVEDANILPFLNKMSNRIEAFVDAGKVPETFMLKGFLDLEIGAQVGF